MTQVLSLPEERFHLIERMDQLIDSWDGTADSGPKVIEAMKANLAELKKIQEHMEQPADYTKQEAALLTEIYRKEKLLLFAMRHEKERLAKEMMGMNKKGTLIQNYLYPKKTPVFVNQDV